MPIVFDTSALLRPPCTAAEFTATKWDSAEKKAEFANKLCKFIAADFKESLFTKAFYERLSMTFGHIAHYAEDVVMWSTRSVGRKVPAWRVTKFTAGLT